MNCAGGGVLAEGREGGQFSDYPFYQGMLYYAMVTEWPGGEWAGEL